EETIDLRQVGERRLGAGVLDQALGAIQHVAPAVEARQGQQEVARRRRRAEPGDEALERRDVLPAEGGAELPGPGLVEPEVVENAAKEIRLADIELKLAQVES